MKLPIQQLRPIKRSLEKYLFTAGTNVALHSALRGRQAGIFRAKASKAIRAQILHAAQLDNVTSSLKKASSFEDDWMPFEQAFDGGRDSIALFLLFAAGIGGQVALDKMIPQHDFELKNKPLIGKLDSRVGFLTNTLDKTGIDWVNKVITGARGQNMSATQIVKLLRGRADEVATLRGELITETELMTGMNLIEMAVYKKNGIDRVIWNTTLDERTCPICVGNEEAGRVKLGSKFPSGQTVPPAHIRCRCYLLPVLPAAIEGTVWAGN